METVEQQKTVASEIGTAFRHSAIYGLGNMLAKSIGFFMLPLYTHFLLPVDYGILEILDLSMSLLGMFLAMGVIAAMLRCYSGARSESGRRQMVGTALCFVFITGVVTFGFGLCFLRPVSLLVLGPRVPSYYFLLSFASLILGYVATIPRTFLRALDASGVFVVIDTATLFCLLGLNIFFIVVLRIGLVGILLSSLIVFFVQCSILVAWTVRRVGLHFHYEFLRRMLAFGAPLMLSNLALFGLNFSDRFFLQHMRSLEQVGIYAVGYKLAFMLNYLLVQPFYVMWQSRMYAIHKRTDHREVFSQIFILFTVILTFAGLALAIFSPEVVNIMAGSKFSASYNIVPIVTLAYVLYGTAYYAQLGMFVADRTKLIGAIGAGTAVLNLLLNYFLVGQFGMMGAAWATLLSFLALAGASYWFSQLVYPLPLRVHRVVGTVLLAVLIYLPTRLLPMLPVSLTVMTKLLAVAAFPVLVWVLRIFSPPETDTIVSARDYTCARLASLGRFLPAIQRSR